jgi:HTH-type transcriptional regulator / antitoxin HipB
MHRAMKSVSVPDPAALGGIVRAARKSRGLTQSDLALAAGTGVPFIVDLERGKPTIQLGKAMDVLHALRIDLQASGSLVGDDA